MLQILRKLPKDLEALRHRLAARCLDELLQLLVGVAVSQLVPVANLRAWDRLLLAYQRLRSTSDP